MNSLTINKPDDWHIHLRDGKFLKTTVAHIAQRFGRACVMPNLVPPITTVDQAMHYHQQIMAMVPPSFTFEPMISLYLTHQTDINTVKQAAENPHILGFKLYPAGATTHSDAGVRDIQSLHHIFEAMQTLKVPLQIHGEVTDPRVDIFDREARFIDQWAKNLVDEFPKLKVVLEHISTRAAVEFIEATSANVAASVTLHHLLLNRNDLLVGGLKPHHYCLPILKTADDQNALLSAVMKGHPKFFFGSDSAPHTQLKKEATCCAAGIYTAHASLELLAKVFSRENQLERLNPFVSHFGADFYQLPRSTETLILEEKPWKIPTFYPYGEEKLIPLFAGEQLTWQLANHLS